MQALLSFKSIYNNDLSVEGKLTCKPGSVLDSHSSRHIIAHMLKQPTRWQHEPC